MSENAKRRSSAQLYVPEIEGICGNSSTTPPLHFNSCEPSSSSTTDNTSDGRRSDDCSPLCISTSSVLSPDTIITFFTNSDSSNTGWISRNHYQDAFNENFNPDRLTKRLEGGLPPAGLAAVVLGAGAGAGTAVYAHHQAGQKGGGSGGGRALSVVSTKESFMNRQQQWQQEGGTQFGTFGPGPVLSAVEGAGVVGGIWVGGYGGKRGMVVHNPDLDDEENKEGMRVDGVRRLRRMYLVGGLKCNKELQEVLDWHIEIILIHPEPRDNCNP
ncbi:hypothetical protein K435DRAFT_873963 [Dendrothele bispora CBS 962.96]|uniref:EF-hand domain-containing protein n=1 Tax=Dendrothele bispora (strain CBS 962.96) TaxID=1314807 RepID=A0A4S8KXU5_DENBC|nr:hypothetical protein K435DRAFT_873963 [Dendrothele bispora CBS 962.96]